MKRISLLVTLALVAGVVGACTKPAPGGPGSPPKTAGPALWGTVVGSVRDHRGQPVARVLVVPAAADSSVTDIPEIAVTSGGDGRYEWHLRPGRYTLVAQWEGRSSAPVPVTVEAGRRAVADLVLPA